MVKKIVLVVAAAVVILGVAVGGVLCFRWVRSPVYSLMQAKKAAQKHDLAGFEKYVDVEGVAGRMVDQLVEHGIAETETPSNSWEKMGRDFAIGLINMMKPQLAKATRDQIASYIERGDFGRGAGETGDSSFSLKGVYDKAGGEGSMYQGVGYVKREGKIAIVGLRFHQSAYDTSLVLEIKMREKGGYWQVAELSNLSELFKTIGGLETQRVEKLNRPIIEAMDRALILTSVNKRGLSDGWGFNKYVILEVRLRNVGQKEIAEYEAVVTCKNSAGTSIAEIAIQDTAHIAPGDSSTGRWTKDVNMFDSSDNELYDTSRDKLDITLHLRRIRFTDGTELKLVAK